MEELQGWTFLVVGIGLLLCSVAPLIPEPRPTVAPTAPAAPGEPVGTTYRTAGARNRLYVQYAAVIVAVVVIVLAIVKIAD